MIYQEKIFKVLKKPHLSEKTSAKMKENNTVVFKVCKYSTKIEIKKAIYNIFNVKAKSVNTVLIKGKLKRHGKYSGFRKNWKKAYITFKKNQDLNLINIKK